MVGGTARRLLAGRGAPRDLGVVVDAPDLPRFVTALVELVEARTGVGPRYALPILADLTADWVWHLPLADGEGNFGSVGGDAPADARYPLVRLTSVGELAPASEGGTIGALPPDLIEGSLSWGGGLPPFDPALIIRGLLADF